MTFVLVGLGEHARRVLDRRGREAPHLRVAGGDVGDRVRSARGVGHVSRGPVGGCDRDRADRPTPCWGQTDVGWPARNSGVKLGVPAVFCWSTNVLPHGRRDGDAELGEHVALARAVGANDRLDVAAERRELRIRRDDLRIVPLRDRAGEDLAGGLAGQLEVGDAVPRVVDQVVHERETAGADRDVDEASTVARLALAVAPPRLQIRDLHLLVRDVGCAVVEASARELLAAERRALRRRSSR